MAHISEILQVKMSETTLSPITVLMQRYQASGIDPEFRVRKLEGADHSPIFEATVEVILPKLRTIQKLWMTLFPGNRGTCSSGDWSVQASGAPTDPWAVLRYTKYLTLPQAERNWPQ